MSDANPQALQELLRMAEPADLATTYLAVPGDRLTFPGTSVPVMGTPFTSERGLLRTGAHEPQPIDYAFVYLTLEDYIPYDTPAGRVEPRDVVESLREHFSESQMLRGLAALNWAHGDEETLTTLSREYTELLNDQAAVRLRNALRPGRDQRRFLARQPLLAAMRDVIVRGGGDVDPDTPLQFTAAVRFSHAVATTLASESDSDALIAGVPEHLFFEVLRIGLLYETDDMWSSIDRIVRLWRVFGTDLERTALRASPADLLAEATTLDLEEILAFGFAMYAHPNGWKPGTPILLRDTLGLDVDPEKLAAFRALVTATPEQLRDEFAVDRDSHFDYLPFQNHPVVEFPEGLLVLDTTYLWDRVTSGLYWLVHDAEKRRSEHHRLLWSQAYGEAIERLVGDSLKRFAPLVLGGGSNLYTEDDFADAYTEGKRCDFGIDYGDQILLVEVVSGQLTVATRIQGRREQFETDTERLVIRKCRQLHDTATAVLTSTQRLTGIEAPPSLTVVPVLVVGGGYPLNPFTSSYIRERLASEQLLDDPRISDVCIIDLGELEALEALVEHGHDARQVLRSWNTSAIAGLALRNHLLNQWNGQDLRPTRMKQSVDETFATIKSILQMHEPGQA